MARKPHFEHMRKGRYSRVRRSRRMKAYLAERAATLNATANTLTPTALASGSFTLAAHGLAVGDGPFVFSFATTQPTGLSATQQCYIHSVPDANTFTITTRKGNVASRVQLVPTTNGSGAITMKRAVDARSMFHRLQKVGTDTLTPVADVDNVR